jgi:predicted RNA-binding protein with PUA-like domain
VQHWLMKSEPDVFGVDDLDKVRRTSWEGVRNYQARNFLRDGMRRGDLAFLYHSSCEEPGIVAIMEVVREAYPDPTQFDRRSPYHDPGSTRDTPRWVTVDVQMKRRLALPVTLERLKDERPLSSLALVRRGNRLSVMPVSPAEWRHILSLEKP